jgi:DNA-binding IclR family transcriptional regulator
MRLRTGAMEARAQGYAIDQDETFAGGSCVAAPVHLQGELIGAVGVSGPSTRLPRERLHEIGDYLVLELEPMTEAG